MSRLIKKVIGQSVAEIKLKGDIDRLRREVLKLKRDSGSSGEVAVPTEALTALQAEIDELEETRERLSKLYFTQLDETTRRTTRLHQLLKVLSQISSHLELETLLQRIAEAIRDSLGYRIVLVRLRDPGSESLRAVASAGMTAAERATLDAEPIPLADFRSWLREDFRVSRSFFFSHTSAFSRVLPSGVVPDLGQREDGEWHPEDVLLVPLTGGDGELIGYLSVDDPVDRMVPSQESIEMLEVFASHALVAIENARLYQQVQARTRELQEANDRMKEMNALKNNFVSTVSHELRTPLTAIRAYVGTLLAAEPGALPPEQSHRFLKVVQEESDRLSRLIESVLDLSRFESGRLELRRSPLELREVVDEAAWLLKPMAEAGQVNLKVANELADTHVDADRDQMRQLVLHLGSNAVKFTPAGGTVTLRVRGDERTVTLRVEDTGIGIPQDELEKIFDRFYQVDSSLVRRYGGTGLGLSISKSIAEAHGGKIVASSAPGQGSCFSVLLKRHSGPRVLLRPHAGGPSASDDVLRLAVEMVSEAMDAGVVSLMAAEPDGDLVIRAAIGLDPLVVRETRVRPGVGVAGWVAEHRRPMCVRPDEPVAGLELTRRERYRSGTFVTVPLIGEHGFLGVLNVTDPTTGRSFDAEDCHLMLDLAERIANAWEKAEAMERTRVGVEDTTDALRLVLQHLKDGRTMAPHRVRLAQGLAREMRLLEDDIRSIGFAATVHDVGMTLVGQDILTGRSSLTAEQRAAVERHVELGVELLRPLETMGAVRDIVLSHHEWWDGSGYPRGLAGADIPVGARILAVVDAFESMTLGRSHRSPLSRHAALNELVRLSGTQFDPDAVEALERLLPKIQAQDTVDPTGHGAPESTNAGR